MGAGDLGGRRRLAPSAGGHPRHALRPDDVLARSSALARGRARHAALARPLDHRAEARLHAGVDHPGSAPRPAADLRGDPPVGRRAARRLHHPAADPGAARPDPGARGLRAQFPAGVYARPQRVRGRYVYARPVPARAAVCVCGPWFGARRVGRASIARAEPARRDGGVVTPVGIRVEVPTSEFVQGHFSVRVPSRGLRLTAGRPWGGAMRTARASSAASRVYRYAEGEGRPDTIFPTLEPFDLRPDRVRAEHGAAPKLVPGRPWFGARRVASASEAIRFVYDSLRLYDPERVAVRAATQVGGWYLGRGRLGMDPFRIEAVVDTAYNTVGHRFGRFVSALPGATTTPACARSAPRCVRQDRPRPSGDAPRRLPPDHRRRRDSARWQLSARPACEGLLMEHLVIHRERQEVTPDDLMHHQEWAQEAMDHVVRDALVPGRLFWGFPVAPASGSKTQVVVGNGRLYFDGGRWFNDTAGGELIDLNSKRPSLQQLIVSIVVYPELQETDDQERDFEVARANAAGVIDATTITYQPQNVKMERRRWAKIEAVAGAEAVQPQSYPVPANAVVVASILMDTTGIVTITRIDDNAVPNLVDVDGRLRTAQGQLLDIVPRVATLASDLAKVDARPGHPLEGVAVPARAGDRPQHPRAEAAGDRGQLPQQQLHGRDALGQDVPGLLGQDRGGAALRTRGGRREAAGALQPVQPAGQDHGGRPDAAGLHRAGAPHRARQRRLHEPRPVQLRGALAHQRDARPDPHPLRRRVRAGAGLGLLHRRHLQPDQPGGLVLRQERRAVPGLRHRPDRPGRPPDRAPVELLVRRRHAALLEAHAGHRDRQQDGLRLDRDLVPRPRAGAPASTRRSTPSR